MSRFRSILPEDPLEKDISGGRANNTPTNKKQSNSEFEAPAGRPRRRAAFSTGNRRGAGFDRNSSEGRARNLKRRPIRKINVNWPSVFVLGSIFLLLIILIPTAISLAKANKQLAESKAIREELNKEKDKLQTSVNDLKNQLEIVNTDEFIQKYAHEKLGMVKPNEVIVKTEDGDLQINKKALEALESKRKGLAPGADQDSSESGEKDDNSASAKEKGAEEIKEDPAAGIPVKTGQEGSGTTQGSSDDE